jgi:ethanolamine transporter
MSFNEIVTAVFAVFFVLGAIDRFIGNKFGLGAEYERAFSMMGTVALIIMGLYCISPVVARVVGPAVTVVYNAVGADPAMFGPTFFTVDAGGYAIATELGQDAATAKWAGIVVSTLIGAAISFAIPLAISIISREDRKFFAVGMMCGLAGTPVGGFFGGLACSLPVKTLLINLAPVTFVAALIILGLWRAPNVTVKIFLVLAKIVSAIIALGLVSAGVQATTGFTLLEGINPLSEAAALVAKIIIVVAGSLPFLSVLRRVGKRPIAFISRRLGVNEEATLAMTISLAIVAPVFQSYHKMDVKGKVLLAVFCSTVSNIFGGHLGFTAAVCSDMILPMFIGKITAAAFSLTLANFFAERLFLRNRPDAENGSAAS